MSPLHQAQATGPTAWSELPLVLIGPMGAGKSTVGARVAAALGLPFVDSDQVVVDAHGPIGTLFAEQGEAHFRALERSAVARALGGGAAVVALGGGAVLDSTTRTLLADTRVVFLTVSVDAVQSRITRGDRPLLNGAGSDSWLTIAETRGPIYASLADITFDTSDRPLADVVHDIVAWARTDPQ